MIVVVEEEWATCFIFGFVCRRLRSIERVERKGGDPSQKRKRRVERSGNPQRGRSAAYYKYRMKRPWEMGNFDEHVKESATPARTDRRTSASSKDAKVRSQGILLAL